MNRIDIDTGLMARYQKNPIAEMRKWLKSPSVYEDRECAAIDMVTVRFHPEGKITSTATPEIEMRGYSQPYFHIVTPNGVALDLCGGLFRANNPSFLLKYIPASEREFVLQLVETVTEAA